MLRLIHPFLILSLSAAVYAQVPYNTMPDWLSVENDYYGTGAGIDDVNGDGFPDLAISNGNDMAESPNFVYISNNGVLPVTATWQSANSAFSGQCELQDYDSDGFPEFAVANFISADWNPNKINIYDNVNGTLDSLPTWVPADSTYSFRLAWGDVDNDGDADLALATGEPYHSYLRPNLVYYNRDGIIQTEPGWVSADSDACLDVRWVDIDSDGDLDLAVCQSGGTVKIYFNSDGSLDTQPGWISDDSDNNNSLDFADIDGDGFPEMAVAANTQLSGSGRFKIYQNDGGNLTGSPAWQSSSSGYGSEVAFCDIDSDGDFDLVCGRWWGLIYVYLNSGGVFNTSPQWNSSGSYQSVIENIVFGDFNRGAERAYHSQFQSGNRLLQLRHRQIAGVDSIVVDGVALNLADYCYSLWDGWVSIGVDASDAIDVYYRYSISKDMAVSNWDRESFVFYNNSLGFIPGDVNDSGNVNGLDIVFLVNLIKQGGTPVPRLAGDTDGNCLINEADVIRLLDFLKGGPAPVAGDCDR